jgi:hypothetical protein
MLSRHPTLFLAMFSWPPGCLRPFNKLCSPRFGLGTQCDSHIVGGTATRLPAARPVDPCAKAIVIAYTKGQLCASAGRPDEDFSVAEPQARFNTALLRLRRNARSRCVKSVMTSETRENRRPKCRRGERLARLATLDRS